MWPGPHCIGLPYQVASSSIHPFGYNRHEAKTVPLLGGAATPSNTTSLGPRFTSVPSGILIHPAVWPQQTLAENWGLCTFRGGELDPRLTQCVKIRQSYTSSSSTSIFVCYAKQWKCDVIVNRCLRLKNQYFFNHDFLHSGTPFYTKKGGQYNRLVTVYRGFVLG